MTERQGKKVEAAIPNSSLKKLVIQLNVVGRICRRAQISPNWLFFLATSQTERGVHNPRYTQSWPQREKDKVTV